MSTHIEKPALTDDRDQAKQYGEQNDWYYASFRQLITWNEQCKLYINTDVLSSKITDDGYISFPDISERSFPEVPKKKCLLHFDHSTNTSIELNTIIMKNVSKNDDRFEFFKSILTEVFKRRDIFDTKFFIYDTKFYDYIADVKTKKVKYVYPQRSVYDLNILKKEVPEYLNSSQKILHLFKDA